jgi:hypothetical protein
MTQALAKAVQKSSDSSANLRVGIVEAIESNSSLTVNVGGGHITGMPYLASYSPAVGDNVTIARYEATWLVLGLVGSPGLTVINGTITTSTTNITGIGATETDLPFLASQTPVVVKAGHIYEFFAFVITRQTVAVDIFELRARRDAAAPGGTEIAFQRFSQNSTVTAWGQTITAAIEFDADDSFNLFWSIILVSGTGTITANPTSGVSQSYMKVTDLGLNTSVSGSPWSVT